MPTYKYRAKKGPGDVVEGKVEAKSETEAIDKISQMGYLPVRVDLYTAKDIVEEESSVTRAPVGRVRSREITLFSRQLASLLKSGVPILEALNIISEQTENTNLRGVINNISIAIKDGAVFSSTLAQYPRIFSPLYISMIRTGEDSGVLHEALMRVSDYRTKQEGVLSRFRMAMAYPVLMGLVGIGTVIFMLTFVMPRLMGIFISMGQSLPMPTRVLISISTFLRQWWFPIGVVVALFILVIWRQLKTKTGRLYISLFKLHIPIFGRFILKVELGRFCRTLELLIKSGITMLRAIRISAPIVENEVIKSRLMESYADLEQGGSFGKSLKGYKLIPKFMSNLLIVGEESGRLSEALSEIASSYERDTEEAMRLIISLLEPLMILVMGLIVGFIVVAMLLPIFEINIMAR